MKKSEKTASCIFAAGIIAFIADVLIKVLKFNEELDYNFFSGITDFLAVYFAISFLGLMTLLVKVWLRKRAEAGKEPISKGYTISFLLSFLPFVIVVINSAASGAFNFMGETVAYGAEAFYYHLFFTGVYFLSIIIPVFPVIIFWQLLYIANRIKYRKSHTKKR